MIPSRKPKGLTVAVDASRNRSGGAKTHLIGILSAADPAQHGIAEVHVWSYQALLDALPERPWLVKHHAAALEKNILAQLWWQKMSFPAELARQGCAVLLSTDAGTLCRYPPSIVMSRDMLSFEPGEMQRYPLLSLARLRLFLLRYMQVSSLKAARAALFLTRYAAEAIQQFSGPLRQVRIVPHGISASFKLQSRPDANWAGRRIRCMYVSNADLYKHQWHVARALSQLRQAGYDVALSLVGAAGGAASARVADAVRELDPAGDFIELTPAVPHHEIPRHLERADIFVFASSCENMPNTLVEAMAAGLPIACSNRGPMPDILEDAGTYFDPEQPDQIAQAVERLIVDPDLRLRCAKKAESLASAYSWERCANETWKYMCEVGNAGSLK